MVRSRDLDHKYALQMFMLVYVIYMYTGIWIFANMLIREKRSTVRFMSQRNQIFGDMFISSRSIKLKLASIIWRVLDELWAKFQLDSTTDDEFLHRHHCKIHPLSATSWRCRKRASFTMGVFGESIYPLSILNEILPQCSSQTHLDHWKG